MTGSDDLQRQVADLADRLDRIERRLGIEPAASPPPPIAPAPPPRPAAPPTAPPTTIAPPLAPRPIATPSAAPPIRPTGVPATPVAIRPSRRPLEMLIGAKLAAWVGALVVVIGAALLIKLGIDEGLWGRLSPLMRALSIGAFGVTLVAAGELALRRISRAASVGLFGAGLGVLYLDAMACATRFDLVPSGAAFMLMAVVAIAGFAVTWRTAFRTIGILSLVGGYATPLLLGLGPADNLAVLSYLTALLGVALALSAVQPAVFRPLRFVALGGQILLGLIWFVASGADNRIVGLVFASGWWGMVLVESLLAAGRNQSGRANAITTLIATAAFVSAGVVLITPPFTGLDWRGPFMLAVAVLGIAAALQFGPSLDALRRRPRTALDMLAVALWAQSAVLIAVAIAIQFEGFGLTVGWLALTIAAVEIGRRLPSKGAAIFAIVVWAVTMTYLALTGFMIAVGVGGIDGLDGKLFRWGGLLVNRWAVAVAFGVAASILVAHRLSGALRPWRRTAGTMTTIAAGAWLGMMMVQASGLSITTGWLAGAIVLIGLGVLGVRGRVFELGLLLVAASAGRWLLLDSIAPRLDPAWDATTVRPFLNAHLALAVAIAAVGLGAVWTMTRGRVSARLPASGPGAAIGILAAGVVVWLGLSFEVDHFAATQTSVWSPGHFRHLLLTMLWTTLAAGTGLLARAFSGDARGGRLLARVAWCLLGALALKWILIDTILWSALLAPAASSTMATIANLQLLAGGLIVAVGLGLGVVANPRQPGDSTSGWSAMMSWAPVLASIVVLWGLTFEVDRVIERAQNIAPYTHDLLRGLWFAGLWGAGGLAMTGLGRWRRHPLLMVCGWSLALAAAVAWATGGSMLWRLDGHSLAVSAFANLQFLMAIAISISLVAAGRLVPGSVTHALRASPRAIGAIAATVIALIAGSLEIERIFAADAMATQAGLSVYWGFFGVGLVVAGFAFRHTFARYAGLALLAITVGKVLFIDLATVERIWRVASFLISGLLLVGTSVLYTKLSPRLLGDEGAA